MNKKNGYLFPFYLIIVFSAILSSCSLNRTPPPTQSLYWDRFKICGAGYSEKQGIALEASYDQLKKSGGITASILNDINNKFLQSMPEKDRLEAYKIFMRCIDPNLNLNVTSPPNNSH